MNIKKDIATSNTAHDTLYIMYEKIIVSNIGFTHFVGFFPQIAIAVAEKSFDISRKTYLSRLKYTLKVSL